MRRSRSSSHPAISGLSARHQAALLATAVSAQEAFEESWVGRAGLTAFRLMFGRQRVEAALDARLQELKQSDRLTTAVQRSASRGWAAVAGGAAVAVLLKAVSAGLQAQAPEQGLGGRTFTLDANDRRVTGTFTASEGLELVVKRRSDTTPSTVPTRRSFQA